MRGELWIKASEISDKTGIAATTLRRYFASFRHYFPRRRRGKAWMYPARSIDLARTIKSLYDAGKSTDDIEVVLAMSVPAVIDVEPDKLPRAASASAADRELLLATLALLDQRQKVDALMTKTAEMDEKIQAAQRAIQVNQETIQIAKDALQSIQATMARHNGEQASILAQVNDKATVALGRIADLEAEQHLTAWQAFKRLFRRRK